MQKKDYFFGGLIVCTVLILVVSFVGAAMDNYNIKDTKAAQIVVVPETPKVDPVEVVEKKTPKSFNGLLIGTDKSKNLTDVMMIGCVDTEKNKISIVSVPRDLVIDFTDDLFKDIKANNPDNHISFCKLNEIYNLTGKTEQSLKDLEAVLTIITGLKIDQVAMIDVDGFSDLVDVIGGVEFNVPERMYYSDPAQDLYIDLQPGFQLLDGDKAEQLARYRHYRMGDLQRIEVQHQFMVALFDKVKSISEYSQVKQLATTGYKTFSADFGLVFALDYAEYFFDLDLNSILSTNNMVTIPSYGEKVGEIWFQTWKIDEAHTMVQELLNR